MTDLPLILSRIDDWIVDAGWRRETNDDALMVVSPGWEVRYYMRQGGDGWLVTRASRGNGESPCFTSNDVALIELFLVGELQADLRYKKNYGRITWFLEPNYFVGALQAGPGFRVTPTDDGWWAVYPESDSRPIAKASDDYHAVKLTYLAPHSPADVRKSFADPGGEPLFSRFLQPPRPPADLSGFRKLHGIPDPEERDAHD